MFALFVDFQGCPSGGNADPLKPWSDLHVCTRLMSKKRKEPLRLNSVRMVPGKHHEKYVCSGPPAAKIPLILRHPRGFNKTIEREKPGLITKEYVSFEDNLSPLEALLKMYKEDEVMSDPGTLPTFPYSPLWKDDDMTRQEWDDF